jgi:hypothetical protein
MKYLRLTIFIYLLVFCLLQFNSCSNEGNPQNSGDGSTTTYFWLAAIKDAYVRSDIPEFNGSGAFSLNVAYGIPNGEHRTYIKFFMPQLPDGSEILEAYINVYEDSRTGQPGNSGIPIGTAQAEWDPASITWLDQPNPVGQLSVGTQIGSFISENMWRTSGDIKLIVQEHLDNPATNFGWILDNSSAFNFTRSFTSMNAPSGRTQFELDKGPRLLIKVKSTVPLNEGNIGTTVTGSNELGSMYGFGVDILVYNISSGGEWPESWEIAAQ